MKKIITLLFCVGAFATSFAQTGPYQNNDKQGSRYVTNTEYKKIDSHRDDIYTFSPKEKDMQFAAISNDFNCKVQSIISNRHIKKSEKKVLIQKARAAKAQQIRVVNATFSSKYNSAFNDHVKQYDLHQH